LINLVDISSVLLNGEEVVLANHLLNNAGAEFFHWFPNVSEKGVA
jgi:hypothetical protein